MADGGTCEFIGDFAAPFAMLVIADLLGVPEEDHEPFAPALLGGGPATPGSTGGDAMRHTPSSSSTSVHLVHGGRGEPKPDVLPGWPRHLSRRLGAPDVIDVVQIAANLFAAGQETTIRLLARPSRLLGDRPDLQRLLRDEPDRIPNFVEETLRNEARSRATSASPVHHRVGGVDLPGGTR